MRFMTDSLSQSINKISQINKEMHQTDENKFIDNMRSMVFSLAQSINKISEIIMKYHKSIKKNRIICL